MKWYVVLLLFISSHVFAAQEYGPTAKGDNLWKIAKKLKAESGLSTATIVKKIQAQNPQAFINGDFNRLKLGVMITLTLVDETKATTVTNEAVTTTIDAIDNATDTDIEVAPEMIPDAVVKTVSDNKAEFKTEAAPPMETEFDTEMGDLSAYDTLAKSTAVKPETTNIPQMAATEVMSNNEERSATETAPIVAEPSSVEPKTSSMVGVLIGSIMVITVLLIAGWLLTRPSREDKLADDNTVFTFDFAELVATVETAKQEQQYNYARSLLRQAMPHESETLDIHLAILAVDLAEKNQALFLADAYDVLLKLDTPEQHPIWLKILDMGEDLCPEQLHALVNPNQIADNSEIAPIDGDAAQAMQEFMVELLQQVEVELAQQNYNQVRSLLHSALTIEYRDDLHFRLLEVMYEQQDTASFIAEAEQFYSQLSEDNVELWTKVTQIAMDFCPEEFKAAKLFIMSEAA